jgi:hypothetical protein
MTIRSLSFRTAFFSISVIAAGCTGNNANAQQAAAVMPPAADARDAVRPAKDYNYIVTNLTKVDLRQVVVGHECMDRTIPTADIRPDSTVKYSVDTGGGLLCTFTPSHFIADYSGSGGTVRIKFLKRWSSLFWEVEFNTGSGKFFYCKSRFFGKEINGYIDDRKCP